MPVKKVLADERIEEDRGRMAFQRGPLIYCAEWPDNNMGNVRNLVIEKETDVTTEFVDSLLGGIQIIKTTGYQTRKKLDGTVENLPGETVTLIPYTLWNNRGPGQMMVWFPVSAEYAFPLPAPAIVSRSKIQASKVTNVLSPVKDPSVPAYPNDQRVSFYHERIGKDKGEWIQYDSDWEYE